MQPEADVLVLFGATGDLSKRKLFPSLYNLERNGRLHVPVIGVARSSWSDAGFRQHAHDSILASPARRHGRRDRLPVRPARSRGR